MGNLFNSFAAKSIGIDLGTSNTSIYLKGKGISLREPSTLSLKEEVGQGYKVFAAGKEAKDMMGKNPNGIKVISPLKNGVVADFDLTSKMLKIFIKRVLKGKGLLNSKAIISVPSLVTEVEKSSVIDVVLNSGIREAYLIQAPIAAAIGAGLPIDQAEGSMIVDIGGGTTEIAVISLGGMVLNSSIKVASDNMDRAIMGYIKKEHNFCIGYNMAERLKIEYGRASSDSINEVAGEAVVKGQDMISSLPKSIKVGIEEIETALQDPMEEIILAIKDVLEKTPPEISSDIMEKGILMVGGGSLLSGLDTAISRELGLPVYIAEQPLDAVVLGTSKILDNLDQYKRYLDCK